MAEGSCGISHTIEEQHTFDKCCPGCVKRRIDALESRLVKAEAVCEVAKAVYKAFPDKPIVHDARVQRAEYSPDIQWLRNRIVDLGNVLPTWDVAR